MKNNIFSITSTMCAGADASATTTPTLFTVLAKIFSCVDKYSRVQHDPNELVSTIATGPIALI